MQTEIYMNYITRKLSDFSLYIDNKSKMNLNDAAVLAERFYREFINELFGWNLESTNLQHPNASGIDLVDVDNKIMIQVTTQAKVSKVTHTLDEIDLKKYSGYKLIVLLVTKTANYLKKQKYIVPSEINFIATSDVWDVNALLRNAMVADIVVLSKLDALCHAEFNDPIEIKQYSDISSVVLAILKSSLTREITSKVPMPFNVQMKIEFNELNDIQNSMIDPLKIYFPQISNIYNTMSEEGLFVLGLSQKLASMYEKRVIMNPEESKTRVFLNLVDELVSVVNNSNNIDDSISEENRLLCCRLILVHAFMDCKIFKDPEGYYDFAK